MNSTIKTIFLFSILTLLLITAGNYIGGQSGVLLMGILGILINIGVFFFSDKIAIKSARAEPLDKSKYLNVFEIVEELTQKSQLPMPRLYLSPNPQPNAFATGRNPDHSAIVVTEGLVRNLAKEELRGVLAHEISHIKNRDILISTVAAVMASLITSLANVFRWTLFFGGRGDRDRNPLGDLAIIILTPLAALILQLAISRSREFKADESGAKLAGEPEGLANALEKIEAISQQTPRLKINPAFSNLYISNPLGNGTVMGVVQKLFSTHPPVEERVKKLREWSY